MEQSSSGSPNSEGKRSKSPATDSKEPANQRMIADRLLAALASGNLDNLAQARQAFLKQAPVPAHTEAAPSHQSPAQVEESPVDFTKYAAKRAPLDLEAQLERRSTPRTSDHSFVPVDELRKEEEELRKAEAELERRRAEVAVAKKKAEEEAKRQAFEDTRRQLELETQRRAEEEELR